MFSLNSPFQIGALTLETRLIQGPLAGFSCAPFRSLFSQFTAPAYCVSEMLSAFDVVHKHQPEGRYLYRAPEEKMLCYQIAGHDPHLMALAAQKLEALGADVIDINCGCPKNKIRKKGAGSALLEQPDLLIAIIKTVRQSIQCPLTVKIRLSVDGDNALLARKIVDAGADALIIHGRRWTDDYTIPCNWQDIARIKAVVAVPIIINGDISDTPTLQKLVCESGGDAFMIARASTGKPWLFQELLQGSPVSIDKNEHLRLFMTHLQQLAILESEHQAVLQSKSLVRYYFRRYLSAEALQMYYKWTTLKDIETYLRICFETA